MKTLFFDAKNYPEHGSVFHRTAIRGVIFRGEKLLLVTNKFGDYKFPGGGADPGESHEETLARELKEETGYSMKPGTCRAWLLAKERRKGITADILEMDSHYYSCEIEERAPVPLQLDDYEAEEKFRAVWISLSEALAKNREIAAENQNPWVLREIGVMECLLEER